MRVNSEGKDRYTDNWLGYGGWRMFSAGWIADPLAVYRTRRPLPARRFLFRLRQVDSRERQREGCVNKSVRCASKPKVKQVLSDPRRQRQQRVEDAHPGLNLAETHGFPVVGQQHIPGPRYRRGPFQASEAQVDQMHVNRRKSGRLAGD